MYNEIKQFIKCNYKLLFQVLFVLFIYIICSHINHIIIICLTHLFCSNLPPYTSFIAERIRYSFLHACV